MASRSNPSFQLTGGMVLAMLLAFFGTVIGVNVYMMKMAISTLPGTEVDSAYSASLGYEKEIAAARAQEARRWQVEAHIERGAGGAAILQVNARDASGNPVSGLSFQGRLERPADKRADQEVALAEVGIGIYRGTAEAIAPGQWDLVLEGDSSGRRLFMSKNRVLLN
ncbi:MULTISPECIES: FixH family protein [unclassified Bradyrhizobium]|uniref:FixH family protein n=1 Tax=unclassified Bradyrhizobium TaxID=2631580 RepID=UPI0028E98D61|nr:MULTISPECIES: FixH family protein [unclassified Bradyrhizobium]